MPDKTQKKIFFLKLAFWLSIGIFAALLSYFAIPFSHSFKRTIFPFIAVLAFVLFFSGIILIILSFRTKIDKKLKIFLILTGSSAAGFFLSVILHNLFYGLAVLSKNLAVLRFLMEAFEIIFFIIAVIACPIFFLIGALGGAFLLLKNK
jgi:hypothetical protein